MEQRSIYYNSEFTQITAAVQEYMHSGLFLSKYKKRNPITWEESQFIKSGELLDLRSVLMGLSSLASDGGKRIADSLNRF